MAVNVSRSQIFSSAALCAVLVGAGCASTSGSSVRSGGDRGSNASLINTPTQTRTTRIMAEIIPCGRIPYDSQTLPLVSPDGRFIATQTQIAPSWDTVLARDGAQVPIATRVEIYRLTDDSIDFVTDVDTPVMLGRSFNDEGFLVEAPQPNGARWIGLASWSTGNINWLVSDEFVNAFASLGPDDRLAWSRRHLDDQDDVFELVIRRSGDEWTVQSDNESWLMPTWSGRGDGLFALTLSDGELDAVYVNANNVAALHQSRRSIHLANNASLYSAYQTIGAHVTGPETVAVEQFIFHHPARARMAIWRPRSGSRDAMTLFDVNTFAVVVDRHDHALVTTQNHLLRQNLREMRDRREVLGGIQVPRVTGSPDWQYILLSPRESEVTITAMQHLE